jgi:hypothetical protein
MAGDGCVNEIHAVKKAVAIILYSLGKTSFGMNYSLTYRWIRDEA